jgi:endoribonuclease Dicer
VLVLTADIFNNALSRAHVSLRDVSLLVFDEAHHCRKRHVYAEIMHAYRRLDVADRPRVFGMTASPVNLKLSENEGDALASIVQEIQKLELAMDAKVITIADLTETQRARTSHLTLYTASAACNMM